VLASASWRSPKEATRAVGGTEVSNPTDFEYSVGGHGIKGYWAVDSGLEFERQNGVHYINSEQSLKRVSDRFGCGTRFLHVEEDGLYLWNSYLEKRWGPLGVGMSRSYTRRYMRDGKNLLRFSFDDVWGEEGLSVKVQSQYETSADRSRVFTQIDVLGFTRGKISLIPFLKYERFVDSYVSSERWQAKLKLAVAL